MTVQIAISPTLWGLPKICLTRLSNLRIQLVLEAGGGVLLYNLWSASLVGFAQPHNGYMLVFIAMDLLMSLHAHAYFPVVVIEL